MKCHNPGKSDHSPPDTQTFSYQPRPPRNQQHHSAADRAETQSPGAECCALDIYCVTMNIHPLTRYKPRKFINYIYIYQLQLLWDLNLENVFYALLDMGHGDYQEIVFWEVQSSFQM